MTRGLVLLLGSKPPPIGGVTRHVERLQRHLERAGENVALWDPRRESLSLLVRLGAEASVVHIHLSSYFAIAGMTALAAVAGARIVITLHGDARRFRGARLQALLFAVRIADVTFVLNQGSVNRLSHIPGARIELSSAFIPPLVTEPLPEHLRSRVERAVSDASAVFCTAAFGLVKDGQGREIYGVQDVVRVVKRHPTWRLIISDPSGSYARAFASAWAPTRNILLLSEPHDLTAVLPFATCMVRNTTTDGDSVAVHESLSLGIPVIATDVVERPRSVLRVRAFDIAHLEETMEYVASGAATEVTTAEHDVVSQVRRVYARLTASGRRF